MARPLHLPTEDTRRVVAIMSSYSAPQKAIAMALAIDENTLRKYYRAELDHGSDITNGKVSETLYRMAVSGRVPAATFFWLKTRAGWREIDRLEITGKDGGPIAVDHEHFNYDNLTREEARELEKILRSAHSRRAAEMVSDKQP